MSMQGVGLRTGASCCQRTSVIAFNKKGNKKSQVILLSRTLMPDGDPTGELRANACHSDGRHSTVHITASQHACRWCYYQIFPSWVLRASC